MTLELDARQRAMLEEMGVKVWLPAAGPVPAAAVDDAPAEAVAAPAPVSHAPDTAAPRRAPAPPDDAPAPHARAPAAQSGAAAASTAALRLAAPQRLYASAAQAAAGGWLVVADLPPGADGRHDAALAEDAGRLLDQMLRALRLPAGALPVHLLRAWRGGGPSGAAADASPAEADFDAAFAGWAAPLAPRLVLALGPLAAQRLVGQQAPLGRLRGAVHTVEVAGRAVPLVASYHPAYLLRNGADKARAWADLCLAAAQFEA